MAAWVLTDNLVKLRSEFNKLAPGRDKASDGSVGDLAHQNESSSGHNPDKTGAAEWKDGDSKNEVRAIDVDASGPWPYGYTMEKLTQLLVKKGREGNLEIVLRYIIFNRRIWRASTGWVTQEYTGPNPHDKHGHFSGAWTQSADENSSYNYGIADLGDVFMGFIDNRTEFQAEMTAWARTTAGADAIADALLGSDQVDLPDRSDTKTVREALRDARVGVDFGYAYRDVQHPEILTKMEEIKALLGATPPASKAK